jgi:hypothetical protein
MKPETESKKDDLVQDIGKLAKGLKDLARQAKSLYSVEVNAIINDKIRDSMRIERCLDGMLDFCFDDGMLLLYKKLCRYYFDIDPKATVSYVNFYREMWDEEAAAIDKINKSDPGQLSVKRQVHNNRKH